MKPDLWSRVSKPMVAFVDLVPNPRTALKLILMSPEDLKTQFTADPEYREAELFKGEIEPKEGVDYTWVWEYAKDTFQRSESIYKELDEKANDIIKYLGGGTGLFTLAVLANVQHENRYVILAAIPAFLLALISIALAVRARQPNPTTQPPDIRSALQFADDYKDGDKARSKFLGQWHLTCVGMDLAIRAKVLRIQFATKFFLWTVVSLAIPLLVAFISI